MKSNSRKTASAGFLLLALMSAGAAFFCSPLGINEKWSSMGFVAMTSNFLIQLIYVPEDGNWKKNPPLMMYLSVAGNAVIPIFLTVGYALASFVLPSTFTHFVEMAVWFAVWLAMIFLYRRPGALQESSPYN